MKLEDFWIPVENDTILRDGNYLMTYRSEFRLGYPTFGVSNYTVKDGQIGYDDGDDWEALWIDPICPEAFKIIAYMPYPDVYKEDLPE